MKVICCGNRDRADDGAALLVAERLRQSGIEAYVHEGGALELLECWDASDDVIIVDAMVTGAKSGTVHCWNQQSPASPGVTAASSHGFGLNEALDLGKLLGRLPHTLRTYGIEGKNFGIGDVVSPEVLQAVDRLALQIARGVEVDRSPLASASAL